MSLKIDFVERAQKGEPIAKLCREFGVSRTTGHKWVRRFRERGYDGLEEESRRPSSAPLATAEELVTAVLEARNAHPSWGPKKLEILLRRRFKEDTPSERTIARILKRANLVRARRRRRPLSVVERAPHVEASAPNAVWTVDFKGWWRSGDSYRCEPLTVRDAFSRFVLAVVLCSTRTADVRREFERLFRQYGIPQAIQCDNGVPFVSVRSRAGLSALSAWWVSLGIRIVRSRPASPQDNGAHERMHRDISQDVQHRPAPTKKEQQRQLSKWRQEFNAVRPHQALGGQTPEEVYSSTPKAPKPHTTTSYPRDWDLALVYSSGHFKLAGERYSLSASLRGYRVALEPLSATRRRCWFYDIDLGEIEIAPKVPDLVYTSVQSKTKNRAA